MLSSCRVLAIVEGLLWVVDTYFGCVFAADKVCFPDSLDFGVAVVVVDFLFVFENG